MTVIFTLLWLPFGKLFHIFQRPAQLGVSFYQGRRRTRRPGDAAVAAAAVRARDDGARPASRRARARLHATSSTAAATISRSARGAGGRCSAWRKGALWQRSAVGELTWRHSLPSERASSTVRPAPVVDDGRPRCRPASSPSGSSRRTAASAASSAASSSKCATTRSSASSRGKSFRSTAACSARRASSATCRDRIRIAC